MKKMLYTFMLSLIAFSGSGLMAQSQSNLDKGMRYVEEHSVEWGLTESDYAGTMVSDMYTNEKTGITYIYLVQAHKGIPIYNAITPVIISPEGKVSVIRSGYIQGMTDKVASDKPSLTPTAAIKSVVAHLGLKASSIPTLERSIADKNIYQFGKASFAENDINVKLTYIPVDGEIKLAWSLAIDEMDDSDYYNSFVDAQSGEVIYKHNYTKSCQFHTNEHDKHIGCNHDRKNSTPEASLAEATAAINAAAGSYNVFALPAESPIHGTRSNVTDPHFTDGSPFGWHDIDGTEGAEFTITRGNNAHAYLDKNDDNITDGGEPDGGASLNFDVAYDINLQAVDNEQAATVNLFYMTNMMHDITNRLGFDEGAGNFQASNYGPNGNGGDYVFAKASAGFDTGLLNNADFATPPDGDNGQMRMFLWTNPSGNMSINSPDELSGLIEDVGTADFGVAIPTQAQAPITGKVAIARDFSAQNNTTICSEVANPDEIAGNIALVDRGLCDFVDKAYYAQEAGAIAVIVCNVVGGGGTDGTQSMGMGSNPANPFINDIQITAISLGKPNCDRIRASILSEIDVNITIQETPPNGPDNLDGSFDNGIIAHEYGHGISNRLIGGPSAAGCLTTDEQMGEGISDYFTLITTIEEGDKGSDARGIGNYASATGINGRGIRRFPYSTDMSINPQVYDDIKTSGIPHPLGEIWAQVLWEIHWAFIDRDGLDMTWEDEDSGNFKSARLAIEGMKIGPCNPSMVDARDAILEADRMLYDGANQQLLWIAFAKRGLGWLADDGAGSDDRTDGTQSFEPLPTVIPTLKIRESVNELVKPGEEVEVTLVAQSHIPDTQTGVVITSEIPQGLSYIDGSASMNASFDNGILTIEVGDMNFNDEVTITYRATADNNIKSETLFLDNVDDADQSLYDFGAIEGFNLWFQSFDVANSEDASWYAGQISDVEEVDFWMNSPEIEVVGDKPVLRFFHRYDSEAGADAGFIQITTDGGTTFFDVKDKWIRNGYPTDIQYTTFAIPLLEGFSGTTNGEFIASYLDLSEFKGENIKVRFRYGTDDNTIATAEFVGWFVDDIELIDLVTYDATSCITSVETPEEQCAAPVQIIIDPDGEVSTNDLEDLGFDINVSPNPASEYISVSLRSEANTPVLLSLVSMDGRAIKSIPVVSKSSGVIRTMDVSDLAAGMYLVQVKTEEGVTTKKVVIQ